MSAHEELQRYVMPLLALRDVVVFPSVVVPLFIGRSCSILALEEALKTNKKIILATQKDATCEEPKEEDIYSVGTICNILQLLKLPDGTVKVLVEGSARGRVVSFSQTQSFFLVETEIIETINQAQEDVQPLIQTLLKQFEQYVKVHRKLPIEILETIAGIEDPIRLVDTLAAHMSFKVAYKQKVLEIIDFIQRVEYLLGILEAESSLASMERRIRSNIKQQMEQSQKEYYLNEQIKAIRKELGDNGDVINEIDELTKKVKQAGMTKEAEDKCLAEINKLRLMSPMSAEATVSRNYIDWLLAMPWKHSIQRDIDLEKAQQVLDEDHYGLEKVKERILEYLAVQKRVQKIKGPILCLIGPPGVGKTSLGKSIARATGREFIRMSLGGVRDEAEIRGHRKTYIGAMPGKILQKISKTKVRDPLFLLDEMDKMASDYRGDPASAMLEVLDPEQNNAFNDHYLEVDYDLSHTMFVATSNSFNIPPALLDRMEVIRIAGYTEEEKLNIATKYLLPHQLAECGLTEKELKLTQGAILEIIRYYTREAGVRNLEREISKLCRKVVREILVKNIKKVQLDVKDLENYLGAHKYRFGEIGEYDRVGQVIGLAWTELGGEILTIEASSMPGKGQIIRTGKLGEVMQESIQAAMTFVRAHSESLGIDKKFHEQVDVHIHVPEGAIPKDGPSAGIAMCTALVSIFTGIPVHRDIAMTGEITLRGHVLPIGGLKEKLLAAKRAGINTVIIPYDNLSDLTEIPKNIYASLDIQPVKTVDEVLKIALTKQPKARKKKNVTARINKVKVKNKHNYASGLNH